MSAPSRHEIGLLRLVAQRIAGPPVATPADAVRWLTAVQGQDASGSVTSVALRTRGRRRQDVRAAFDRGEVVKSWPMRGTLHLVAAEDLGWLLRVGTPRVLAGSAARRRAQLGIDDAALEAARELAVRALAGGRRLRRADLFRLWDEAGVTTAGQRGYHVLAWLAQTGTLCFGPTDGGPAEEQLLVLVEEWIQRPRQLDREQALGELALRYFRGHGPATVQDFARWTKLSAAEVRGGVGVARPELAVLVVDGVEYLLDPGTRDLLEQHRGAARGVVLLPGFDEYVLGYGDRSAVLSPEFADRIVPGGNGVFRPTVVSAGQVVGTWRSAGRGPAHTSAARLDAVPFTTFGEEVEQALPEVYAALPS